MASPDDPKGAPAPAGDGASISPEQKPENGAPADTRVSYEPVTDASYAYDDPYTYGDTGSSVQTRAEAPSTAVIPATAAAGGSGGSAPPPPPSGPDDGDEEEGGMLRMSFLEHLEELRSRILRALAGVG